MAQTSTSSFSIINEQQDFVIVNKKQHVNFHDEGVIAGGLFNQVKKHLNIDELYPVHRLDKMTSGLIIFAKNKKAAAAFQVMFSAHQVEKYYIAISDNKPKKKQGLIKGDMEKSRRSAWKLLRTQQNPAITQFFSYGIGKGLRLYILKPHSGRTHQIRVALSSISAPILGDPIYSKSTADRGYLHAYALRFTLFQQPYAFTLFPDEGEHFINSQTTLKNNAINIEQPWLLNWPLVK